MRYRLVRPDYMTSQDPTMGEERLEHSHSSVDRIHFAPLSGNVWLFQLRVPGFLNPLIVYFGGNAIPVLENCQEGVSVPKLERPRLE